MSVEVVVMSSVSWAFAFAHCYEISCLLRKCRGRINVKNWIKISELSEMCSDNSDIHTKDCWCF